MRVLIVEDEPLLREGLRLLFESHGHQVAGAMAEASRLDSALSCGDVDVLVIDVRLPPGYRDEGLRAAINTRRDHPEVGIVALSSYVEVNYASELLADPRGGLGYLLEDRIGDVASFMTSVSRVADGATIIDPEVISTLFEQRRNPLAALSARERDVLALMAEGLTNHEIAERLDISDSAVAKHVGKVFRDLGLADDDTGNRRVRAVLALLSHRHPRSPYPPVSR
ncbi:LuxR C-terminal-related transcriptional regulator [Phytoactinopolyspora limicola]|uniref:LuxR C-terminal-related transcriptional regulator n=1 Tax=Phytoactinopolyspora limicola TaxID=2715536 RepID=UPI0014077BF8|nr:response regulator transcription factor [Phytoactinopolyspora limicola]